MSGERVEVGDSHPDSWRIPSSGPEYGVLVRHESYFWLLCPATATLYLRDADGLFDLTDCQMGLECDYLDDVHAKAHTFVKQILADGSGAE